MAWWDALGIWLDGLVGNRGAVRNARRALEAKADAHAAVDRLLTRLPTTEPAPRVVHAESA